MPFGSWRESELDTFQKIAKGQLTFPRVLSSEAEDLITKVSSLSSNFTSNKSRNLLFLIVLPASSKLLCSCLKLMKTCGLVAKEVQNQSRNIPGSMVLNGKLLVTANFKFLKR